MSAHLLAATIGPVQDFIAHGTPHARPLVRLARSVRISKTAAAKLANGGGKLIFPAPGSDLGQMFRRVLCERGDCANDCAQPRVCRYCSLFEGAAGGTKPYVILAPSPPGLEEIVLGSQASAP